jgi:cytochrome c556
MSKETDNDELNVEEYIKKSWGENEEESDINKVEESNEKEDTLSTLTINEGLKKNKKYTAKTEKELQKEKGKYFLKISLFIFIILLFIFLLTLIIKTIYAQESLENRKTFKEQEKIVEIEDNPSDFWKKKMQLKINDVEIGQESFKEEVKKSITEFETNTSKKFTNFEQTLSDSFKSFQSDFKNNMDSYKDVIEKLEKNSNENNIITKTDMEELKKEIEKVKKNSLNNIQVQLPNPKSFNNNNTIVENISPKIEPDIIYEDISITTIKKDVDSSKGNDQNKKNVSSNITIFSGFIKVISLTSIKGPTGTKASSETHPVRLQTMGELIGANNKKINLDSCYLRSIAKGDITTLRNLLTLDQLYCNGKDEKGDYIIQVAVKGQVHDELDGGLGFPGVLVDSAGKLLTKELSLAIVQGAAQMLDKTENIVFPDVGSFSTNNTSFGQEFSSGVGGGFSKGLEGIVNYWRDILKGYYPFIDSKAARIGQAFVEIDAPLEKKYYDSSFELSSNEDGNNSSWESIIE